MMPAKRSVACVGVGLATALFVCAPPAAADNIVDFESVPIDFYQAVQQNGVVFTNVGPSGSSLAVIVGAQNCVACADNGTHILTAWGSPPAAILMTTETGSSFALQQFDAAESFAALPQQWAARIDVTGQLVSGATVFTSFTLDHVIDGPGGLPDFQTFVLPQSFQGLTSVLFVGAGNPPTAEGDFHDFAIDNVTTDLPPPVPEPATGLLVIAGVMTGVAGARRRRRTTRT
jgi:hypothetical protein